MGTQSLERRVAEDAGGFGVYIPDSSLAFRLLYIGWPLMRWRESSEASPFKTDNRRWGEKKKKNDKSLEGHVRRPRFERMGALVGKTRLR